MNNPIDPQITLGVVALTVSNFAQSLPFYQERIGLTLRRQEGNKAYLGTSTQDLLLLHEDQNATPIQARSGLYHFALLVSTRLALAQVFKHLIDTETPLQGVSDHHVSEAIYLADPDGNGIEIYRDRPRNEWPYRSGQLQIGTVAMDIEGVLGELANATTAWSGLDDKTKMGHIHLHVANLEREESFYRNTIGFDLIMRYGTAASFLSAGGYHHHVGMNTWSRVGPTFPPANATGLQWYTIQFPNQNTLASTLENLQAANVQFQEKEDGIYLQDHSQNGIRLTVIDEETV